jgi:hypothetical protein
VIAGIKPNSHLKPNGRVFAKLAKGMPVLMLEKREDGDEVVELTHEERFILRFHRWLAEPLRHEFDELIGALRDLPTFKARCDSFMPKLREYEQVNPPPWKGLQGREAA